MLLFDDNTPHAAPVVRDRRRSVRHATVLLVGRVGRAGRESVCLVHDISPLGLMARFPEALARGERVEVAVRGMLPAAATVRWVRGHKAGLAFDSVQDIGQVLAGAGEGRVPRAPRFPLAVPSTVQVAGRWQVVELVDLSAGGAKLVADIDAAPDAPARLSLPGLPLPVTGAIRWHAGDRVGMRFSIPLALPVLATVLDAAR